MKKKSPEQTPKTNGLGRKPWEEWVFGTWGVGMTDEPGAPRGKKSTTNTMGTLEETLLLTPDGKHLRKDSLQRG